MASVKLEHVTKMFNKVTAVDDADIEVHDKEFVVLVGPSGCGKSTVLRMISGLEEITSGDIYIGDKLVNNVPPKNRDIAMVFQNYALYPHMTVYQNMAFGLKLRKYPKKEIQKRVADAAELLEIGEFLDRKPKALSGGQRQRVAVGRAIVRNPKVFLFDEPLSNLDAKLRVQMRTEILKLHKRLNATMIYVTHDQVEAMTMGDRIVVLKDGKVQQIDTPIRLYDSPKNLFIAGFIGSPPINLLSGKLYDDNGLCFTDGSIKIKLLAAQSKKLGDYIGKEIICGIRPEDIYDSERKHEIKDSLKISVTVEVREMMGNEVFLHANTGANPLIARLGPWFEAPIGAKTELLLDISKIHFFDKETGLTIKLNNTNN